MKRSRLKPVSKRRSAQNREYSRIREEFMLRHACEPCPVMREIFGEFFEVTDLHHKAGREGDRLIDVLNWLAVSREGHNWIHSNPAEARKRGWLI